ncbi:phage tail tape measure protein [Frankia sp. AgB1.9]|uniref:phage tail tape measure protein n=1 Tax=unclassified Frankia TaxID=2632575 RepID=UPI001934B380|nr:MULTISPECIES: phage tail tape measure protein [unclassified Frankia]MBL7487362.1 phage tail tape measure protein [Frankia sp. AgW1.1]MBL7546370.1 phage tail tape measure protein [Frankia sp. AgB1.9]MBL7618585.1 phage tail tape measure protein [Frankia sp. AgB1.8]
MSDLLPPAVIRLITDTAEFAAGMKEAVGSIKTFAEQGTAAVKAADDAMAASGAEGAAKWGAAWDAEWAAQGVAADRNAMKMQVAQSRAATAGTLEWQAALDAQVASQAAADAKIAASREKAVASMNDAMVKFGKASAVGLVAIAAESVHLASSFDAEMEKLNSQLGMTIPTVNSLKSQVLSLAGKVGQDPDSLAEALLHVEAATKSMGVNAPKAMDVLTVAGKAAAVSGANLTDVTNALDAAMVSGLPGMQNLSQATGQLVAAVGEGDMSMQDMADAFGKGNVAIWKNYGMSVKDVTASLALFGDMNGRGAQAGTQFTNVMKYMLKPAGTAKEVLGQLHLTTKDFVTGLENDIQKGGLPAAITDLKGKLDKLYGTGPGSDMKKAVALTDLFGSKGGQGIQEMIGSYDVYMEKVKAAGAATGDINKAFKQTEANSFSQQMKELKEKTVSLGIELGNKLIPPLEHIADFFAKHPNIAEGMILSLGALMGISVAMWIGDLIAGLLAATGAMLGFDTAADANPIGAIIIAVALLAAGIYELIKHWKGVETAFRVAWAGIKIAWFATWDALKTAWHAVVHGLEVAWDAVLGGLKTAWHAVESAWHAVWGALKTAWHDTLHWLSDQIRPFVNGFKDSIKGIEKAWHDVTGGIKKVWHDAWHDVKTAVSDTWHVVEPILKDIAKAINLLLLPIRLQILAWEIAYRAIEKAVKWFWHSVLEPFGKAVASILEKTIGTAIRGFETAWRVVWNALGKAVDWVWNSVLSPTFHWIAKAFDTVIGTALRGLETAWHTVWGAIKDALSAIWNGFLSPIFHTIAAAFDSVIGFALRTLKSTWDLIWGGIKTALSDVWHGFLEPTFHFIANAFDSVIGFGLRLLESTWKSIWGDIKRALSDIWDGFLSPTFHSIGDAFDKVIGAAGRGFQTAWNTIWGGIKGTVDWVWGAIKTTFDSISRAIHDITGGISTVAGKVGGFVGTLNKIAPFADGGSPPVGQAVLVGERGPELAVFGAPAYIHPAGETQSMLAGGKATGGWVGLPSQFGSSGAGPTITVIVQQPDINLNGRNVYKGVQQEALRVNRRNPTNGLARIAGR